MKRAAIFVLLLGCSKAKPSPPPTPASRPAAASGDVVTVGDPARGAVASFDRFGNWGLDQPVVDHWLLDMDQNKERLPENGDPKRSLFRKTIPLPQVSWEAGDFEVTALVFPAGSGVAARYHVMNHGTESRSCRLFVGARGDAPAAAGPLKLGEKTALVPVEKPAEQTAKHLAFDLKIDTGASQFIHVVSPDLAGTFTPDALDEAAARWERKLGGRRLVVPDESVMTSYYLDLAGSALRIQGCEERLGRAHEQIARPEGDALRLLPSVPAEWLSYEIEVQEIPTAFGPLTLKYEGAFESRSFELGETCRPPGGFRIEVPAGYVAKVDGKEAPAPGGVLRVPAGARKVDLARRL